MIQRLSNKCWRLETREAIIFHSYNNHQYLILISSGPGFRFVASENFSLDLPDHFVRLEARKSVPGVGVRDEDQVGGGLVVFVEYSLIIICLQIFLPGSGIAAPLLAVLRKKGQLEVLVLSKFCEEGDNTRDGLDLADYSNQALGWSEDGRYRAPHSWKLLFGGPPPTEMFW